MLEGLLFYFKLLGKIFNLNQIYLNLSHVAMAKINSSGLLS
jgi:hypothetical protein